MPAGYPVAYRTAAAPYRGPVLNGPSREAAKVAARLAKRAALSAISGVEGPIALTIGAALVVDDYNARRLGRDAPADLMRVSAGSVTVDPIYAGWSLVPGTTCALTGMEFYSTSNPSNSCGSWIRDDDAWWSTHTRGSIRTLADFPVAGQTTYSMQTYATDSSAPAWFSAGHTVYATTGTYKLVQASSLPMPLPERRSPPIWAPWPLAPGLPVPGAGVDDLVVDHGPSGVRAGARGYPEVHQVRAFSVTGAGVGYNAYSQVTPRSPPDKGEKEKKKKSKAPWAIIEVLDDLTEKGDVIDALYDAIEGPCKDKAKAELKGPKVWHPEHVVKSEKSKRKGQKGAYLHEKPYGAAVMAIKANAIYECLDSLNVNAAIFNVIWSQKVEDFVWGQLGLKGKAVDGSARYGGAIGATKIAFGDKVTGKAVSEHMGQAKDAVRSWLERTFGIDVTVEPPPKA